jgi:hypothetical protein
MRLRFTLLAVFVLASAVPLEGQNPADTVSRAPESILTISWNALQDYLELIDPDPDSPNSAFDRSPWVSDMQRLVLHGSGGVGPMAQISARKGIHEVSALDGPVVIGVIDSDGAAKQVGVFPGHTYLWAEQTEGDEWMLYHIWRHRGGGGLQLIDVVKHAFPVIADTVFALPLEGGRLEAVDFSDPKTRWVRRASLFRVGTGYPPGSVRGGKWSMRPLALNTFYGVSLMYFGADVEGCVVCDADICCPDGPFGPYR